MGKQGGNLRFIYWWEKVSGISIKCSPALSATEIFKDLSKANKELNDRDNTHWCFCRVLSLRFCGSIAAGRSSSACWRCPSTGASARLWRTRKSEPANQPIVHPMLTLSTLLPVIFTSSFSQIFMCWACVSSFKTIGHTINFMIFYLSEGPAVSLMPLMCSFCQFLSLLHHLRPWLIMTLAIFTNYLYTTTFHIRNHP